MKLLLSLLVLVSCGKPQLPGTSAKRFTAKKQTNSQYADVIHPLGYDHQIVNTPSTQVEEPVAPTLPTPNPIANPPQPTDGNYEIEVGSLYGATVYAPRANKKFPVIVWGNGCRAGSFIYRTMLKTVAKQGYVVVQSGKELSNKSVSKCEAHSNFYTPLTQLASSIKNSPHKSMESSKIIFAGHSMGASAAIAASRNYSSTSAVVAFTPCVYYDKDFGGLPKPTLVLEAGSYMLGSSDLSSVCNWQSHYNSIKSSSNQKSIYAKNSRTSHMTPSSTGVFSNFLVNYLDCYIKGKNNKCSGLRRSPGWSIR